MAKTPKPKDAAAQPAMLQITVPAKGRWRIGRHFGQEAISIEVAALTEDEIDALMADPELTVIEVAATAPTPVVLPPA